MFSDEFLEEFIDGQIPCLATNDENFAAAAIANMKEDKMAHPGPCFAKYHPHSKGHLFEFDTNCWDGATTDTDLKKHFDFFGLPMPSSYSMFSSCVRSFRGYNPERVTVCVDLVPRLFSAVEIASEVRDFVLGAIHCQWDGDNETDLQVDYDLVNPEAVRSVYVTVETHDAARLGAILTQGLDFFGFLFRTRQVFSVYPYAPVPTPRRPATADAASQTLPVTSGPAPRRPATLDAASQTPPLPVTSSPKQTTPASAVSENTPPLSTPKSRRKRPPRTQPALLTPPPTPPRPPPQCFKCHGWNHVSKDCPSPEPRCRKCAGHHRAADCVSKHRHCAVCQGPHVASSRSCPQRPPHPPSPARASPDTSRGSTRRLQHRKVYELLAALCKTLLS